MAGIGDSWGTAQELMHPRDSHGRFRTKWKMSPAVLAAVEKVLQAFRPRTFQSDGQAAQYNFNLASRKPGRFGGGKGFARLQADYHAANEDLRDGNIDDPSTRKFVDMMDQAAIDLPDDIIASRVVGPDAFGLTPEQLPQLEEMTGNVIADRGYGAANIGTPVGGGQGLITMVMATPKGTKMIVPGRNRNDRALFYDRDQEFTVTKVKPDGRGGYTVYAVATPKTAGATPAPENVGHQGPGISPNREAAVKALENAQSKREMGAQPAGQAPPGASGAIPQTGTPEEQRAAQRAQILGRPAGPNATPQAQQEAAAPPAPTPATPVPSPTPAPAPNVPATPAAAPQAPSGVTSVVTGNPATSFREVAKDLESPSAGPRRREWNSAYQGIVSGKQHPQDMLRELEADIAHNKEIQKTEPGLGDSVLAHDIEKQEKLADLIRSHFNLGEPVQRQPRQEVRNELQAKAAKAAKAALLRPGGGTEKAPVGKKTAIEAAHPGPLAKVAPKRAGTPQERAKALGAQREQDLKDNALNAEQRARWSDQVGKEPASLTPDNASSILLDETADQLRNGRTTRAKAVERLRNQARDQNTPEAAYLLKVADAIEADTSKPAKRVPLKKAAPKAPPNVAAAEASLEGRTEKNILTGLNKLSVGDMRAVAEKWGIDTRGEDKKLKLKAALAKELAAHWKATPELQRKKEGGVPGAPSVPAKAAPRPISETPPDLAPEDLKVYKRLRREGVPREEAIHEAVAAPLKAAKAAAAKKTTPRAKALTKIAESPDVPAVVKKAAKKAAVKKAQRTELTKAERDANLPELSRRVLAGEPAGAVINDIRARHGLPAQAPAEVPAPIPSDPVGQAREAKLVKDLKVIAEDNNLTIKGRPTKEALRAEIIRQLEEKGGKPAAPATPAAAPETKIPGIDTAERARLQARAKEVLAELRANPKADPFEELAKRMGPSGVSPELLDRAKKIRAEVERTSGPSGISVEDRVAARLLASIKPEYRQGVLDEMSLADRKHVLDVAERVAAEDARVKKSGHDLDRILSDAGIKKPGDKDSQPVYEEVKQLLANNNVSGAQKALADELRRVDFGLESYRKTAGNPNAPQLQREYAGEQITKLLGHSEWLRSVAGALHGGSTTSPELIPKKQIKEVIRVNSPGLAETSPEDLKQAAQAAGIKLPEAATTRDEIITEMAREMIRRELAGKPVELPPVPLSTRKPKAPVEHHAINARTLVEGAAWDESNVNPSGGAPSDKRMLDRIQGILDGNPEDVASAGLQGTPTPAAVGRYLDSWANGAGGPGTRLAMTTIGIDRIKDDLKQANPPDVEKNLRDRLAEIDSERAQLRAQHDRWTALAAKLKKTRRTPVTAKEKQAATAAEATPLPPAEVAPIKKVLARAAKSAPAKKLTPTVTENLSGLQNDELKKITESPAFREADKALVGKELARRLEAEPAKTGPKITTLRQLEFVHGEDIQKAYEEGRISPTLAVKGLRRQAEEMRSLVARGEMGLTMGKAVSEEKIPGSASPTANLKHRADLAEKFDQWANNIEAKMPAKKATKKAAAAAAEDKAAKGIATLAQGGNRDFLTSPNATKALPGASVGEDNRLIRAARDRKKQADEDFRRAEAKVANIDPQLDNPEADQWENDLEAARNERDAADEDLKNLLERVRAKNAAGAAAPSAPVETQVAKAVAKKAARKEVQAEVAKKTAPVTVSNAPGGKKYTEAELQDMTLGDLVDIESERGIKRTSVAKADRIRAILDQQEAAPAPEPKKVTAKASKAAAAKIEAAPPSKAAPTEVSSGKIQAGKYSSKPALDNTWGGFTPTPVHYHEDGEIGLAVGRMGNDRALEVDGDRLDNVIGRIATDTVMGRTSEQEMIDKLKKLEARLPEGSVARSKLASAIEQIDSPPGHIDVPKGTPAPLTDLAKALAGIPLARKEDHGRGSDLERLNDLISRWHDGKVSPLSLLAGIRNLENKHHESQEGKFEVDRAIAAAHKAAEAIFKDKSRRHELSPSSAETKAPEAVAQAAGKLTDAAVEQRVRDAYNQLTHRPGQYVTLTDLRELLKDLPRDQVDRVLTLMNRTPSVTVAPDANQKALRDVDREAAVFIGGTPKHAIAIGHR